MNASEEKVLRENIRQMIRFVKQKRVTQAQLDEQRLRGIIQKFIEVEELNEALPDDKPTPLLKKIIPQLEIDFRQLTTSDEQRKSYRAHIINAVINTLTPTSVNTQAGQGEPEIEELEEVVDIDIAGEDEEKFIDIRTDAEKAEEEEEEQEADPKEEFGAGMEGADETGRNVAFQSFNKVEGPIIDAYELLSNDEDQELFYDYLIANLKLYFDKFEAELSATVEEPTNQAYETAKQQEPMGDEEVAPALEENVIVWKV